jgi:hypothetical protein
VSRSSPRPPPHADKTALRSSRPRHTPSPAGHPSSLLTRAHHLQSVQFPQCSSGQRLPNLSSPFSSPSHAAHRCRVIRPSSPAPRLPPPFAAEARRAPSQIAGRASCRRRRGAGTRVLAPDLPLFLLICAGFGV